MDKRVVVVSEDSSTLILLGLANLLADSKVNTDLKDTGVSLIGATLLEIVAERDPDTVTPTYLSRKTGRVKHDISGMISRLQRDGLVTVGKNPHDSRSKLVNITPEGRRVFSRTRVIVRESENRILEKLSDTRIEAFRKDLGKILENSMP
jgi:DNA-binding MarR family transcriptional regulator